MTKAIVPALALILTAMSACSPKNPDKTPTMAVTDYQPVLASKPRNGNQAAFIPRALIYRTNGDYNDNVPISIGPDGQMISFPAPGDVRDAWPLVMADGWLLDRRGVGQNTRFTRYTYAQYSALAAPPTIQELRAAVIPGARVTEAYTLPMSNGDAYNDTTAVNDLIRQGLPGCKPVIEEPVLQLEE